VIRLKNHITVISISVAQTDKTTPEDEVDIMTCMWCGDALAWQREG
jgi:hypothetical protein